MHRHSFILMLFVLAGAAAVTLAQPEIKKTAITIYNQNLGVVKETRAVQFPAGISKVLITDVAQQIEPTSVKFGFNGTVLEQNYKYDLVSLEKILARYIDKQVQLVNSKGELIEGRLLSVIGGQTVLQRKDGGLVMLPNISDFRFNVTDLPEGLITRPTLECMAEVEKAGKQDVLLSYQTGGMNWHAEYVAVLNESDNKLDLNSWVSIQNNSGASFKDCEVRLIAGDINRPRERANMYMDGAVTYMAKSEARTQFQEESFFEYHLYELQRNTTLANNETKQISLFEKRNISAVKKFLYRANEYGGEKKVQVVVEFENKENNNMGVPMPKGKVRMFKANKGSLELIGEDNIDHTPRNERVTLEVGKAFDIAVEDIQTDNRRITDRISEASYKITLKNRKKEDVTVEVSKNLWGFWEITKSSIKHEKRDASTAVFQVPVAADSEKELTFTVRFGE